MTVPKIKYQQRITRGLRIKTIYNQAIFIHYDSVRHTLSFYFSLTSNGPYVFHKLSRSSVNSFVMWYMALQASEAQQSCLPRFMAACKD